MIASLIEENVLYLLNYKVKKKRKYNSQNYYCRNVFNLSFYK